MSGPVDRTEKLALGIADVSLGQTGRQIPAGDPPPLAPNGDLAVIGKSIPRIGGRAMVTAPPASLWTSSFLECCLRAYCARRIRMRVL